MIRLFVGLELPDDVRQRLRMLNGGVPGARWVQADNFHVSLRFIGEVDEGRAADIDDALATVRSTAFDLNLQGVGAFGRGRQLKTLWAGVENNEALSGLHDKIDRALLRAGLPADRRKFTPHVTLARLKAANAGRVEEFTASHAMFTAGPVHVTQFVLYSSLLSRNGAIYRGEAEYPLQTEQ